MKLKRRLNKSPLELGITVSNSTCPDIWETASGEFVIIGKEVTAELQQRPQMDVKIHTQERAVLIPRVVLISAKLQIPNE